GCREAETSRNGGTAMIIGLRRTSSRRSIWMTRRLFIAELRATLATPSMSAPRKRGPITTGRCCRRDSSPSVIQYGWGCGYGSRVALRLPGTTSMRDSSRTLAILPRRVGGDRGGGGAVLDPEL